MEKENTSAPVENILGKSASVKSEADNEPIPQPQPKMPVSNPLRKHFRAPGVSVFLPSRGAFYTDEVEFNDDGSIEILPMTAGDELLLKNPDALMNGVAIEKLILSCAPSIKKVKTLVAPDVDIILLAIRSISYGEDMEIPAVCPECETSNVFTINIQSVISQLKFLNKEYVVDLNEGLKAYIKPYTFAGNTKAALAAFEEGKVLQALTDSSVSEEQQKEIFNNSFNTVAQIKVDLTLESIQKIVSGSDVVVEKEFIKEFLDNAHKNVVKKIDDMITEINKLNINRTQSMKCQNCQHEWEANIEFDPAHFFG